jgi:kumamolisin
MSDPTPDLSHLDLRPLPGSERSPAPDATAAEAPLDPAATIEVTLVVRRRQPVPDEALT